MKDTKKGKILTAARLVFLRYGYKRVSMNEIAEAAGVSRPALYLVFKNKEELFAGVVLQWAEETLSAVKQEMAKVEAPAQKLSRAFDLWTVQPFKLMLDSPEAKELMDGSFAFAQDALKQGYQMFEAAITPTVASLAERRPVGGDVPPAEIAHLLASATRGFKQTAAGAAELRQLIEQLLMLCFRLDQDAFRQHAKVRRSA
jgi:AcrR family transcriptional regulator